MKPEVMWNTWRRILRTDGLWIALTDPTHEAAKRALAELSAEEREVFDHHAGSHASDTYVGVYRRFLFDSMTSAIRLVPLCDRIFEESAIAHLDLLEAYSKASGYRDDGPNFWRTAGDLLTFLQGVTPFSSGAPRDATVLEITATKVARNLCDKDDVWAPRPPLALGSITPAQRFVQRGNALIAQTAHDLSAWIENPKSFDPKESLPEEPCWWAVYFEAAEERASYVELSERAAAVFDALKTPQSSEALAKSIADLSVEDAQEIVTALAELEIIVPS